MSVSLPQNMKTVADFRRLSKTVKQWHFVSDWFCGVRTVAEVKSGRVGFTHPFKKGSVSWIDFPKASAARFEAGGIVIRGWGDSELFYRPIA